VKERKSALSSPKLKPSFADKAKSVLQDFGLIMKEHDDLVKEIPPQVELLKITNETSTVPAEQLTNAMNTLGACYIMHKTRKDPNDSTLPLVVGNGRIITNWCHTNKHIFFAEHQGDDYHNKSDLLVVCSGRKMEIKDVHALKGKDYAKIEFFPIDVAWIYKEVCVMDPKSAQIKVRSPNASFPDIWGLYSDSRGSQTIHGKILQIENGVMTHSIPSWHGSSGMSIVNKEGVTIAIHKGALKQRKENVALVVDTLLAGLMNSNMPLKAAQRMLLN
jgi:hypothetical protein